MSQISVTHSVNMKMYDLADYILSQFQAGNSHDPELFQLLLELVVRILRQKKSTRSKEEEAEIALNIAEDVWKYLYSKSYKIYSLAGYISKLTPAYIADYLQNRTENIDTIDSEGVDLDLDQGIKLMNMSSFYSYHNDLVVIEDHDVIRHIPRIVDRVMDSIRYYPCTPIWYDIYVSILVQLIRGVECSYGLSEGLEMYNKMIVIKIKEILKSELLKYHNTNSVLYDELSGVYDNDPE